MYGYIYDVFLSDKRYEKDLIRIENTLTDSDLKGHTIKLSLINNLGHAVQDLLQRGVKTIVVVGSDQLYSKLLDYVENLHGIVVGLIPLGSHQQMAQVLGIPEGEAACQTLAARMIKTIRLGKINSSYFLYSVFVNDASAKVSCDGLFDASATSSSAITSIYNPCYNPEDLACDPRLEVAITPTTEGKFFKKAELLKPTEIKSRVISIEMPRGIPVVVDGQKIIKTPVQLTLSNQSVSVIVGKERKID